MINAKKIKRSSKPPKKGKEKVEFFQDTFFHISIYALQEISLESFELHTKREI